MKRDIAEAPIPFALPCLGKEEEEAVIAVMRSGWITTGPQALAFEREFADFVGMPHALALNSATAGLHLALEALGIGKGDAVICSPYTFASTAEVARYLDAEVVFADIGEGSFNVDPEAVERAAAAHPEAKAIIAVHVGGLPCDMEALRSIAARRGLFLIEDAAHAFPSRTASGMAGTLSDIGVFSFYATKTITTAEGGMVVTRDEKIASRMSTMRLHGIDRAAWGRYSDPKASWRYQIVEAGYKYNMTDMAAAMGREQLKKADAFLEARRSIARRYDRAFGAMPWLSPPPGGEGHAWHLYSLSVEAGRGGPGRDDLAAFLQNRGIGVSVHFIPLHLMPYWQRRYGLEPSLFPRALERFHSVISLPIWPGMSDVQVERVIQTVLEAERDAGRSP